MGTLNCALSCYWQLTTLIKLKIMMVTWLSRTHQVTAPCSAGKPCILAFTLSPFWHLTPTKENQKLFSDQLHPQHGDIYWSLLLLLLLQQVSYNSTISLTKCSNNTAKNLRFFFLVFQPHKQTPAGTRWRLCESIPLHSDPTPQPTGAKRAISYIPVPDTPAGFVHNFTKIFLWLFQDDLTLLQVDTVQKNSYTSYFRPNLSQALPLGNTINDIMSLGTK